MALCGAGCEGSNLPSSKSLGQNVLKTSGIWQVAANNVVSNSVMPQFDKIILLSIPILCAAEAMDA